MRASPLLLLAFAGAAGAGFLARTGQGSAPAETLADAVHVWPFGMMTGVRDPSVRVPMQVQVYNEGEAPIALESLAVRTAAGELVAEVALAGELLPGDGGELASVHVLLETLDPELTHRHENRVFIPEEQRPRLTREEEAAFLDVLLEKVGRLKETGSPQARNLTFEVELEKLFSAGSLPGDEAELDVTLTFREPGGRTFSRTISHSIGLLHPYMPPPADWQPAWSAGGRVAGAWQAGDMHVHNCRDQATLGCPNCAAESFNLTGSFTNAQLKPQFQALGMSFFSTTTHSYCINGDPEFNAVAAEATSLDDPSFQVILGTEMTNKETGNQSGVDLFDAVCSLGGDFGRGIAHMGGHFLASRKPGGSDGFLQVCNDPMYGFEKNVDLVNAEGGIVNVNHPSGSTLGFNSVAQFRGFEAGKALGVEIWNGGGGQASGDHRAWWLARMREGHTTYPWSGSDTHDAAFDFGAMHTWVEGVYDDVSLKDALANGRTYISDGPFLDVVLSDDHGRSMGMGGITRLNASNVPPNYPVHIDVSYNTAVPATIRVFVGEVFTGETLLQEFPGTTGAGTLRVDTVVPTAGPASWYRAELFVDGAPGAAYSTPQFLVLRP